MGFSEACPQLSCAVCNIPATVLVEAMINLLRMSFV